MTEKPKIKTQITKLPVFEAWILENLKAYKEKKKNCYNCSREQKSEKANKSILATRVNTLKASIKKSSKPK